MRFSRRERFIPLPGDSFLNDFSDRSNFHTPRNAFDEIPKLGAKNLVLAHAVAAEDFTVPGLEHPRTVLPRGAAQVFSGTKDKDRILGR
jgi:hypothetical protein